MIGVEMIFLLLFYVFLNLNSFTYNHTSDVGRFLGKAKNDFIDLRLPCPASVWETCRRRASSCIEPRLAGVVASSIAPLQGIADREPHRLHCLQSPT
jgi:hypothetical protein